MKKPSIKNWSKEDRPREKLILNGKQHLSNAELIAILIGSGNRELSAVELSKHLMHQVDNNIDKLSHLSISELTRIKGIGEAKAISLIAGLELGKRCAEGLSEERENINSSEDVFNSIGYKFRNLPYEEFWVLYLNRSNKIIEFRKISQGGISGTVVDTRLILKHAINNLSSGIILAHNHPSGNISPSEADIKITKKLKTASALFDINILDHLIICDHLYFSFSDEAIL